MRKEELSVPVSDWFYVGIWCWGYHFWPEMQRSASWPNAHCQLDTQLRKYRDTCTVLFAIALIATVPSSARDPMERPI